VVSCVYVVRLTNRLRFIYISSCFVCGRSGWFKGWSVCWSVGRLFRFVWFRGCPIGGPVLDGRAFHRSSFAIRLLLCGALWFGLVWFSPPSRVLSPRFYGPSVFMSLSLSLSLPLTLPLGRFSRPLGITPFCL